MSTLSPNEDVNMSPSNEDASMSPLPDDVIMSPSNENTSHSNDSDIVMHIVSIILSKKLN
jgi:hypothetical protein